MNEKQKNCGKTNPPPKNKDARETAFREAVKKIGTRYRKTFTELAK